MRPRVSVCTTQKPTLFSERRLRSLSGFRSRLDSIGHKADVCAQSRVQRITLMVSLLARLKQGP